MRNKGSYKEKDRKTGDRVHSPPPPLTGNSDGHSKSSHSSPTSYEKSALKSGTQHSPPSHQSLKQKSHPAEDYDSSRSDPQQRSSPKTDLREKIFWNKPRIRVPIPSTIVEQPTRNRIVAMDMLLVCGSYCWDEDRFSHNKHCPICLLHRVTREWDENRKHEKSVENTDSEKTSPGSFMDQDPHSRTR